MKKLRPMLLLYCIVSSSAPAISGVPGIRNADLRSLETNGLRLLYSVLNDLETHPLAGQQPGLHPRNQDAAAFQNVLNSAFEHAAIIPFRFPTLLESESAARDHILARAPYYCGWLERMRDRVQMSVIISFQHAAGAPHAPTGVQYLQNLATDSAQLTAFAQRLQQHAGSLVLEWKQHAPLADRGKVFCFCLIPRTGVLAFRDRLRSLLPPPGITMTISGPWPAARFLDPGSASS